MALPTVFMPFCYYGGTKPVVLCRRNEQVTSWNLAWTLKGYHGVRVIRWPTPSNDEYSYWRGIRYMISRSEDFFIVEQDIAVQTYDLYNMTMYADPVVVMPYELYPASIGRVARPIWDIRQVEAHAGNMILRVREWCGEPYADLWGFGVVLFRREVLPVLDEITKDPMPWWDMDARVSTELWRRGIRARVYMPGWPALHYHQTPS